MFRRKVYYGVRYGTQKDPRGGWRAWWRYEGEGFQARIHECATRLGAEWKARHQGRRLHNHLARTEALRKAHGYYY